MHPSGETVPSTPPEAMRARPGMAGERTRRGPAALAPKTEPLQDRSRQTFDLILRTAGELLAETGIERFSTNLVCRRAGITPPALYRYFPDKYALLSELGRRLMQAQDDVVYGWIARGGLGGKSVAENAAHNHDILRQVIEVTAGFPGGLWILRAMRAVPRLRDVRLASSAAVSERIFASLKIRYASADPDRLRRAAWLTTELSNAVIEMVLERPGQDADEILLEAGRMMAGYYWEFG